MIVAGPQRALAAASTGKIRPYCSKRRANFAASSLTARSSLRIVHPLSAAAL
jgi:hypothetical protein